MKKVALLAAIAVLAAVLLFGVFKVHESYQNHDGGEVTSVQPIVEALENGDDVIIKYHATWCGYCKQMAGEWNDVYNDKQVNKHVKVVSIESEQLKKPEFKEFNKKCNLTVDGFPTIVKVSNVNGKYTVKPFNKARKYAEIKEFALDLSS
tara:strand:+ start:6656 stop:7105 length:450 start_codon:yes stop_codon:yes gene_type:complete